jgi:hypothetical protein
MDNESIQKQCNELLKNLGVPGFIVFGFKKPENNQFGVVYSTKDTPPPVVVKCMSWALNDFSNKKL